MKKLLTLMFAFALVFSVFMPMFTTEAYADKDEKGLGKNINDFNVEIDSSGKLSDGFKDDEVKDSVSFWNKTFKEFKKIILGVNGLAMLGSVFFLIRYVVKLQASAGNPQEAAHAKKAIFISMIATAVLGVSLGIVGYLWYLLA